MLRTGLLAVIISIFSSSAHADFDPMIEVGTGVSSGITEDGLAGLDVLLRVGFSLNETTGEIDPVLGPEQFVVAKITGDFQFATDGGPETLRYLDIRLIPLSSTVMLGDSDTVVTMGGLDLLPMQFSRNVYVDNAFSVDVHVVGVRLANRFIINEKISFFTELAGKLLGYKMRSHVDEALGNFHGVSIGELGAQLGMAFQLGEVALRIFVGGDADLALGGSGGGFSVHSDLGAHAGLALDISQVVRRAIPWVSGMSLFVKAAYLHSTDTGNDSRVGSGVLLGGFSIFF